MSVSGWCADEIADYNLRQFNESRTNAKLARDDSQSVFSVCFEFVIKIYCIYCEQRQSDTQLSFESKSCLVRSE